MSPSLESDPTELPSCLSCTETFWKAKPWTEPQHSDSVESIGFRGVKAVGSLPWLLGVCAISLCLR